MALQEAIHFADDGLVETAATPAIKELDRIRDDYYYICFDEEDFELHNVTTGMWDEFRRLQLIVIVRGWWISTTFHLRHIPFRPTPRKAAAVAPPRSSRNLHQPQQHQYYPTPYNDDYTDVTCFYSGGCDISNIYISVVENGDAVRRRLSCRLALWLRPALAHRSSVGVYDLFFKRAG